MNLSQQAIQWFQSLSGREGHHYNLVRYIDHGNIGFVYEARSRDAPGWQIVLKLVPDERLPEFWQNEIRKVSQLSKVPGVVHFHGLGRGEEEFGHVEHSFTYTVWDYIPPGRNLKAFLDRDTNEVRPSFMIGLVEGVLKVLHACRCKGVLRHGDLHAGNILIGEPDDSVLDDALQPRLPVYVSDFGYGATGVGRPPKDDYEGLANICNTALSRVDWDRATPLDRHTVLGLQGLFRKLLQEPAHGEKREPLEILRALQAIKVAYRQRPLQSLRLSTEQEITLGNNEDTSFTVGQFQVSEMLGERWELWKKLFVSAVPARSRILGRDINIVLTGPRGCGKTMLLRRLSARLMVECGPPDDEGTADGFVGVYVNANDIADAFADFPSHPSDTDVGRLICYANLCFISELLSVESSRSLKNQEYSLPQQVLNLVQPLFRKTSSDSPLLIGENPLEEIRLRVERTKWEFSKNPANTIFPGYEDLSRILWLPKFIASARAACEWIGDRPVYLFVDDYTTPRVSISMQRVLNRLFFQRSSISSEFVCKIATESATTFVAEDSSGKILQDGDDYQLVDIGEEALFMKEEERGRFLNRVLSRRLSADVRIPQAGRTLHGLLGNLGISKTEFARRLRAGAREAAQTANVERRGATKPSVLYHGEDVLASLWSGDTRIMIQLVQELLETGSAVDKSQALPISAETQDRVFRDRGSTWLEAQARNRPSDLQTVEAEIRRLRQESPDYELTGGSYGTHLKAVVEAFKSAAREALFGPVYVIGRRQVPKMAFRIEVTDELRLRPLAREIYRDLIRYGLFLRDARGKSVRGAMVPRLYLRRLLLPYCALALSKRDSVQMNCESFNDLLIKPDEFRQLYSEPRSGRNNTDDRNQITMPFVEDLGLADPAYDDLGEDDRGDTKG